MRLDSNWLAMGDVSLGMREHLNHVDVELPRRTRFSPIRMAESS